MKDLLFGLLCLPFCSVGTKIPPFVFFGLSSCEPFGVPVSFFAELAWTFGVPLCCISQILCNRRLRLLEDLKQQSDLQMQLLQDYIQSRRDELAMLDATDTTTARDHDSLTSLPVDYKTEEIQMMNNPYI